MGVTQELATKAIREFGQAIVSRGEVYVPYLHVKKVIEELEEKAWKYDDLT